MKRIIVTCLAAVLAVPAITSAGAKWAAQVEINPVVKYARGAMGAARNSRDQNQQIGCYLSAMPIAGYTIGLCWATDADGATAACRFTAKPQMERILAVMSSDSLIHFNWNEHTYECERLDVQNGSMYEAKK